MVQFNVEDALQEVEAATKPVLNTEALEALGKTLSAKFLKYEKDRSLAELKWARNARQFLGIYDPEVELLMDKNRSKAYPKLTRVKCVSMLSRLMNLLFPADDRCWAARPSAVPDLMQEDLQKVLDDAAKAAETAGHELTDEAIEQAIRTFARGQADRLELEMEDQLQTVGGDARLSFVQLCRQVIYSGILYGMGVLKGPYIEKRTLRTWVKDADGKMIATPQEAYRPRYEFVPIWDYYPDMSAKYLHQMEGQFERHVMSKHQLIALKSRPDFFADQIDEAMRLNADGNYKCRTFETELKNMGVHKAVGEQPRGKFEVMAWEGHVSGKDLAAVGAEVPENLLNEDVEATVWLLGDTVIKAELSPWTLLDAADDMPTYHQFVFEEDESSLLGNGLPNIMRDSQMSLAAAVRMTLDNASLMRVFEINTGLLTLNQDTSSITPDRIFYRDDNSPATAGLPALRVVDLPLKVGELQSLVTMFQGFADQETFVGPATGGDMSKGPSEPFRTAAGASMLQGAAALPFKDVVRNFDRFMESVIGSLIVFNRNYNPDPRIRGDFQPVARGATSLIAKEVLGIQLDNFATTLTDGEKPYVKFRELARARARVRDLVVTDIVVDDAEADAIDARAAEAAAEAQKLQAKTIEAEIRKTLADTLKAISQSGKNTAAADATTAGVLLDALEKGLPIDDILKSMGAGKSVQPAPEQVAAAPEQAPAEPAQEPAAFPSAQGGMV